MKLRVPFFQKSFKFVMPSLRTTASQSINGGKSSWGGMSRKHSENKESQSINGGKSSSGGMSRKHGENKVRSSKQRRSHEMVSQWRQQVSAMDMQEMEEAFKFFDGNNDGKITVAELASALKRLGDNPTEEEVREMLKEADMNGDGVISFEEFLTLQSSVVGIFRQEGIFRQDLKQAFLRFDVDGNGLISPEELQGVLARLGHPCSLPDCHRMISRIDLDGDGQVNFEEFLSMMKE